MRTIIYWTLKNARDVRFRLVVEPDKDPVPEVQRADRMGVAIWVSGQGALKPEIVMRLALAEWARRSSVGCKPGEKDSVVTSILGIEIDLGAL